MNDVRKIGRLLLAVVLAVYVMLNAVVEVCACPVIDDNVKDMSTETNVVEEDNDEAVIIPVSAEDMKLIGQVVVSEALWEPDIGKIYVIDTILNRVDNERFPNTIEGVVKQPNQYVKSSGSVPDEIMLLVQYEVIARTNRDVLYFRNKHYHTFGTPVASFGNHYFSK